MRLARSIVAALAGLLLATAASGETNSALMQVSVEVVPNCRIAVTDLAFGDYDPLERHASTNLDGTARVRVVCTKNERATILMEQNGSEQRALRHGQSLLAYGIFSDPARTKIWGGGASGVQVSFEHGSAPQELTVFGRIPAGQVVPAGYYIDSVTATVDF
jgi:spore coat protein U-like protein